MDMNPRDKIPNMKIFFINIFSIFALMISGLSMAQTQKSLVGFQGVPWGSSISTVRERFPNSKQRDVCKDLANSTNSYDSAKKNLTEDNSSCQILNVDSYMIDGIKFHLKFGFDAQNKLSFAVLDFRREQALSDKYISECISVYDRISRLLDTRYGNPISNLDTQNFAKDFDRYSVKAWLPLPSEVWVANLSGDKFLKRLAEISNKSESDACVVKVHYTKRVSNEALKL
jgi:hypothetical protein